MKNKIEEGCMASPSRKEGLRCECGKLLLEKDPVMGLGARCGRCSRFHSLEEIVQKAAKSENLTRREKMKKDELEKKDESQEKKYELQERTVFIYNKKKIGEVERFLPIREGTEIYEVVKKEPKDHIEIRYEVKIRDEIIIDGYKTLMIRYLFMKKKGVRGECVLPTYKELGIVDPLTMTR